MPSHVAHRLGGESGFQATLGKQNGFALSRPCDHFSTRINYEAVASQIRPAQRAVSSDIRN